MLRIRCRRSASTTRTTRTSSAMPSSSRRRFSSCSSRSLAAITAATLVMRSMRARSATIRATPGPKRAASLLLRDPGEPQAAIEQGGAQGRPVHAQLHQDVGGGQGMAHRRLPGLQALGAPAAQQGGAGFGETASAPPPGSGPPGSPASGRRPPRRRLCRRGGCRLLSPWCDTPRSVSKLHMGAPGLQGQPRGRARGLQATAPRSIGLQLTRCHGAQGASGSRS